MPFNEDLIDFPCSPVFVKQYARMGLTQDYPPEYYSVSQNTELAKRIEDLETRLKALESSSLSPTMKLGMALAQKEIAKQKQEEKVVTKPVTKPVTWVKI